MPEDTLPADLTELDRARVWHLYAARPGARAPLMVVLGAIGVVQLDHEADLGRICAAVRAAAG